MEFMHTAFSSLSDVRFTDDPGNKLPGFGSGVIGPRILQPSPLGRWDSLLSLLQRLKYSLYEVYNTGSVIVSWAHRHP